MHARKEGIVAIVYLQSFGYFDNKGNVDEPSQQGDTENVSKTYGVSGEGDTK